MLDYNQQLLRNKNNNITRPTPLNSYTILHKKLRYLLRVLNEIGIGLNSCFMINFNLNIFVVSYLCTKSMKQRLLHLLIFIIMIIIVYLEL